LVFNLDEVGIPDWEGRKTRKVVLPMIIDRPATDPAVSRNVKHISVIPCVLAAGKSLMPYIVTSQNSLPLQEQLREHGVRFG
jgi:hypothetical protein